MDEGVQVESLRKTWEECDKVIKDNHTRRLQIMCSKPPLYRCEVKESLLPNTGRGVFATRDIEKGELITMYPCDISEYTPNKDAWRNGHLTRATCSDEFLEEYDGEKIPSKLDE